MKIAPEICEENDIEPELSLSQAVLLAFEKVDRGEENINEVLSTYVAF